VKLQPRCRVFPGVGNFTRSSLLILALATPGCIGSLLEGADGFERQIERSFRVEPGSLVSVDVSGSSVTAETGPPGTVTWRLKQVVHVESEDRIQAALDDYEIHATQEGDTVQLVAKRKAGFRRSSWTSDRVRFSAVVILPADVRLKIGTSGGSIRVTGERDASLDAGTSGGSITVDGGAGAIDVDTSGGSIRVGRALGSLRADTSGGSISVDFVGRQSRDVLLATSGGSIRVGVDPAAAFDIAAETSGGSVSADLPLTVRSKHRSQLHGTLNGGGAPLRATTSGGSIRISAAR
jgi:hypothetical protein